jgi:hypothetical protein
MPDAATSAIHVTNPLGLVGFVIFWFGLVACAKFLLNALRNDPLIGWSIGPLGVSTLFLYEPTGRFLLFSTLFPALVSGTFLYLGLFTNFPSPLELPHHPFVITVVLVLGILLTCLSDWIAALRDLRYPLWGEVRVLRNIQYLRASCAMIRFTPFGLSYLQEHFGSNPRELLQAL